MYLHSISGKRYFRFLFFSVEFFAHLNRPERKSKVKKKHQPKCTVFTGTHQNTWLQENVQTKSLLFMKSTKNSQCIFELYIFRFACRTCRALAAHAHSKLFCAFDDFTLLYLHLFCLFIHFLCACASKKQSTIK